MSSFSGTTRYDSPTPFDDYIRLGQSGGQNTRLEVLDINRSRPGRPVFQTLAVLNRVAVSTLETNSFVL
ncbi:MAG: hypothetical protein AAFU53_09225 [Cyanobacteria bacterium J06632_3]